MSEQIGRKMYGRPMAYSTPDNPSLLLFSEMKDYNDHAYIVFFSSKQLSAQKEQWQREAFKAGQDEVCVVMCGQAENENAFETWFKGLEEK